MIECAGIGDH